MNRTRLWMFGGAVAILAVLAGGWFVGVDPLLAQAASNESERSSVESLNAIQEARILELQEAGKDMDGLADERDELITAIPTTPSMSAFLGQLAALAESTGVQITSLTANDAQLIAPPAAEAPAEGEAAEADAEAAPVDEAAAAASAEGGMITVPISLSASGSFEALMSFLERLQTGDRLIAVAQLNVAGSSAGEAGDGGFTFDLTGSVFVQSAG